MSLFVRRRQDQTEERGRISIGGTSWFYAGGDGVSGNDPLRSVAHWAARRVLCESMAGLPVDQIRKMPDGSRVEVTQSVVVRDPDGTGDQQGWIYQVMDSWLDAGNVYGLVVGATSMGLPTQVVILAPAAVSWRDLNGVLTPHVNNKPHALWPLGDLWHSAAYRKAGSPIGLSPTEYARQSVKTSIAAEKFGGDFFNAPHPTADVSVGIPGFTVDQANEVKSRLEAATRDRKPFVHGKDIVVTEKPVNPTDSQFIELLRFECEQASRIYGVPPGMIYAAVSGQSVTYSNASDADLAFMKHSLRPWVRRLQFQWSRFLPAPQFVSLNVNAFLEMTPKERAEVNKTRLISKTTTINEVRAKEDEPRFDDPIYDLPGIPGAPAPALLPQGGAA